MLPTLTVNRSFISEFIAAEPPCFALGMVEEQGRPYGLFALRPEEEVPPAVSDGGFNFGHALFGRSKHEATAAGCPQIATYLPCRTMEDRESPQFFAAKKFL